MLLRMSQDTRSFIIESLRQMHYDVSAVGGDTPLGPTGMDLESLAVAELALMVEQEYGVRFGDEDAERTARMTVDEFAAEVDRQAQPAPSGGRGE
jgi:acyl carrier protein